MPLSSPDQQSRDASLGGRRPGRLESLGFRLTLLVFLAVLPAFALTLQSASEQRRLAAIQARDNALGMARVAARTQSDSIEAAHRLLAMLAQLPVLRERDAESCEAFLADLGRQHPEYVSLLVIAPSGDVACGDPTEGESNFREHDVFQRVISTRSLAIGEYRVNAPTKGGVVGLAYPILNETGESEAVLLAGLDANALREAAVEALLPPGSILRTIDRKGAIVARYPNQSEWAGQARPEAPILEAIARQRNEGTLEAVGEDGVYRLYAYTPLPRAPDRDMFIYVGIPTAIAFAEANRNLSRNLITLAITTALALALARSATHNLILQPVEALLAAIRHYDAGDFAARVALGAGFGEIGSVGRALNRMAATVHAREAERDRFEADLRQQSARAEATASIAAHLNAHVELNAVLETVCHETASALSLQATSLGLYDPPQRLFQLTTCWGIAADFCWRIQTASAAVLAPLHNGQLVLVPDVASEVDAASAADFTEMDIRSFAGVPIVHEGQLLGALLVFARGEARRFTDNEIVFLEAIADQAAAAIVNARLYESLKREKQTSARLLHGTITAQEDERKRIARELHDETIQDLIGVVLSLDAMELDATAWDAGTRQALQTARSAVQSTMAGIRRLIGDLRPSLLDDLGLVPAIAWYADRLLQPLGMTVEVSCNLEDVRLSATLETALFRIGQEAVNNIARHSICTEVDLALWISDGTVILSIHDNGQGFSVVANGAADAAQKGFGLQGIRERVAMLGGAFNLESSPGQGTTLDVRMPLMIEDVRNE